MARSGLERSCTDWVASSAACEGVQRLRAWFAGAGYGRHRHDAYAIGLTDSGVQSFWYRGSTHSSVPGEVVVLHPDETHDGYAGTDAGFGYRIVYIEPARIADACRAIAGRACPLPFLASPVQRSRRLRKALEDAFAAEPADEVVYNLADGLMEEAGAAPARVRIDEAAVERARELLQARSPATVHSSELEAASGLSRFELARQFRARLGTSPYRYSLLRRLEWARGRLEGRPLAEVALEAGFADQAHFTRSFKAAYGVSPGRARRLAA